MSYDELHTGKLKPVPLYEGENLEEQIKRVLKNIPLDKYCSSYREMIIEYDEYVVINNTLYSIEDVKMEDGGIFVAKELEDGSIEYTVQFYNGGCCLSEALEYALKRMKTRPNENKEKE